jgi:hypothetical protein
MAGADYDWMVPKLEEILAMVRETRRLLEDIRSRL